MGVAAPFDLDERGKAALDIEAKAGGQTVAESEDQRTFAIRRRDLCARRKGGEKGGKQKPAEHP